METHPQTEIPFQGPWLRFCRGQKQGRVLVVARARLRILAVRNANAPARIAILQARNATIQARDFLAGEALESSPRFASILEHPIRL